MNPRLAILVLTLSAAIATLAQRTTRKSLRIDPAVTATTVDTATDTIFAPQLADISLSGYDKPLRSNKETFFATNHTAYHIRSITITIEYFDKSGRQLNKRTISIDADLPAEQTRMLTISSWDVQQSFFYELSTRPRRADATPYSVLTTIDSYIITRPQ